MSSSPKVIRWGILATGGISKSFSKDLLVDPTTRGETSIQHKIVAVGSRSVESASEFIKSNGLGEDVKPYGSYAEFYQDQNIDVVYVGTPHSHHYENVKDVLNADKHCLCEKAFTVNQQQAVALFDLAKEKNLFLMEAMWTRFQPVAIKFQELVAEGRIGKVVRVFSDLSIDFEVEKREKTGDRMTDPALAGGALLDLGPYSLNWVLLSLFPHPAKITTPTISAQQTFFNEVDLSSSAILTFEGVEGAIASMSNSMAVAPRPVVTQGTEGTLELIGPPYRPEGIILLDKTGKEVERFDFAFDPKQGGRMFYEADEVARCIAQGKTSSARMPREHSLSIMNIFDEIRKQGGLVYPESIEKL